MNPSSPRVGIGRGSSMTMNSWSSPKMPNLKTETGPELWIRLTKRPSISGMEPMLIPSGPQPGDIIELTGLPGSGKSIVIYHLILSVLLPKKWKGANLGGSEAGVIFVDTDLHFNIFQLENMLHKRVTVILKKCKSVLNGKETDSDCQGLVNSTEELKKFLRLGKQNFKDELSKLTKQCLKNFVYFRCSDSTKFAMTLLSVFDSDIDSCKVSLMVIDSLSAFYWYDRIYRANGMWRKVEQYYNKMFGALIAMIKKHKMVLISTRQSIYSNSAHGSRHSHSFNSYRYNSDDNDEEYEYLGKQWAKAVTCHIHLSVTKCQTLTAGKMMFGENSRRQKSEETENSEGQTNSTEDEKSLKSNDSRTVHGAEVKMKDGKITRIFTVHEEGIKWLT